MVVTLPRGAARLPGQRVVGRAEAALVPGTERADSTLLFLGRAVGEYASAVVGLDVLACLATRPSARIKRSLAHFVAGVARGRRLGVVVPVPLQIDQATTRWQGVEAEIRVEAGSPYADIMELEWAVEALRDWRADLVVLDCIGFTGAMKTRAAGIAGVPVILPRTVLARTLAELL